MISRHLPRQVHGMLHDVPRWLGCFGCWAVVASPKVCRRYHNVYGKIVRKSFEMGCFLIFHVKITRDMQRCSQLGISCEEMWCQRMWTQQWQPSRPSAPSNSWIGAPLASSVASTINHLQCLNLYVRQNFWPVIFFWEDIFLTYFIRFFWHNEWGISAAGSPSPGGAGRWFGQGHACLLYDFQLHRHFAAITPITVVSERLKWMKSREFTSKDRDIMGM